MPMIQCSRRFGKEYDDVTLRIAGPAAYLTSDEALELADKLIEAANEAKKLNEEDQ